MTALLFGARGNLGSVLGPMLEAAGYTVIPSDQEHCDITDEQAVRMLVHSVKPDLLINAAAFNAVDACEDASVWPKAFAVNGLAPGYLARAALEVDGVFVHMSTDYVFAGDKREGYLEDDIPHPISRYGESKRLGEQAVQEAGGKFYLCRTSRLFGPRGASPDAKPSFPELIFERTKTQTELQLVDEEYATPTYTVHLAQALLRLVKEDFPSGIYHLVSEGPGVTWYGFACEFLDLLGVQTPRKPISSSAFPTRPAKRPASSALLNTRGPKLPPRLDALREFFQSTSALS